MTMKPKFCERCGSPWVDMEGCTNEFCPMPADGNTGYILESMIGGDPLIELDKLLQRLLDGEFDDLLDELEQDLRKND